MYMKNTGSLLFRSKFTFKIMYELQYLVYMYQQICIFNT